MERREEPKFQADPDRVLVFKVLAPIILLGGWAALIWTIPLTLLGLLILAPWLLWGVFSLTAAQIRPTAHALRYRRLFRWKEIPYDQIVECKTSWAPAMGWIRLRHRIPPWGKLYFVLEGPLFEGAFPGGQTQLTRAVNARVAMSRGEASEVDPRPDGNVARNVAMVVFFGFALAIALRVVSPLPTAPPGAGLPAWMGPYFRIMAASARWPWGLITCGVLAAGVRWQGLHGRTWILVAAIGATLGMMIANAL